MFKYTNFRKTDDSNIVLADREFTEEIHLGALVGTILKQMSAIKAAKEILANDPDEIPTNRDILAEQIDEMEAEFVEYKAILKACEEAKSAWR